MKLPILEKLKDGVKFDFDCLADNQDQTELFWHWWWSQAGADSIIRPETIIDSDPILVETVGKTDVDLCSNHHFFNEFLTKLVGKLGVRPRDPISRSEFRSLLVKVIGANSINLQSRPQLVFAGGGYGSGKTTILGFLAKQGKLPLGIGHIVGVDCFKLYVPEFNVIQEVADGRASVTVQKECKMLGEELFAKLVSEEKSFIWDSSMSEIDETMKKIDMAKGKGFEIQMVGVLTSLETATSRAMARAKETRRFPHKDALPKSHIGFRKGLMQYVQNIDDVIIFANSGTPTEVPLVIAQKSDKNELVISDEKRFNALVAVPEAR